MQAAGGPTNSHESELDRSHLGGWQPVRPPRRPGQWPGAPGLAHAPWTGRALGLHHTKMSHQAATQRQGWQPGLQPADQLRLARLLLRLQQLALLCYTAAGHAPVATKMTRMKKNVSTCAARDMDQLVTAHQPGRMPVESQPSLSGVHWYQTRCAVTTAWMAAGPLLSPLANHPKQDCVSAGLLTVSSSHTPPRSKPGARDWSLQWQPRNPANTAHWKEFESHLNPRRLAVSA